MLTNFSNTPQNQTETHLAILKLFNAGTWITLRRDADAKK